MIPMNTLLFHQSDNYHLVGRASPYVYPLKQSIYLQHIMQGFK